MLASISFNTKSWTKCQEKRTRSPIMLGLSSSNALWSNLFCTVGLPSIWCRQDGKNPLGAAQTSLLSAYRFNWQSRWIIIIQSAWIVSFSSLAFQRSQLSETKTCSSIKLLVQNIQHIKCYKPDLKCHSSFHSFIHSFIEQELKWNTVLTPYIPSLLFIPPVGMAWGPPEPSQSLRPLQNSLSSSKNSFKS